MVLSKLFIRCSSFGLVSVSEPPNDCDLRLVFTNVNSETIEEVALGGRSLPTSRNGGGARGNTGKTVVRVSANSTTQRSTKLGFGGETGRNPGP